MLPTKWGWAGNLPVPSPALIWSLYYLPGQADQSPGLC